MYNSIKIYKAFSSLCLLKIRCLKTDNFGAVMNILELYFGAEYIMDCKLYPSTSEFILEFIHMRQILYFNMLWLNCQKWDHFIVENNFFLYDSSLLVSYNKKTVPVNSLKAFKVLSSLWDFKIWYYTRRWHSRRCAVLSVTAKYTLGSKLCP